MGSKQNEKCKAVTKNQEQCKKRRLPFSPYCWLHYPKNIIFISLIFLILGAILGTVSDGIWEKVNPPASEERRDEVVSRIAMEAAGSIQYTNLFLTSYLNHLNQSNLLQEIKSEKIENAEEYFNSELDEKLEEAFMDIRMLDDSGSYISDKTQLAYIVKLRYDIENTRLASEDFLNKYGSVDHKIVTVITDMLTQAEVVIMILDYAFKDPEKLKRDFREGNMDQFADFLSGFYLYQLECKTLIQKERPDIEIV